MDYRWWLLVIPVLVVGGTLFPLRHSPVALGMGLLGWTFIALAGLSLWKTLQGNQLEPKDLGGSALLLVVGLVFLSVAPMST